MADLHDLGDRRARRTGLMKEHGERSIDSGVWISGIAWIAQTAFRGDRG
jgi:hypothetical protein